MMGKIPLWVNKVERLKKQLFIDERKKINTKNFFLEALILITKPLMKMKEKEF